MGSTGRAPLYRVAKSPPFFQRLLDLKQPDVELPAVFDPLLIWELNAACQRVTGVRKYPALHISNRDTGERFGLQYVEPGCRPVVLNWDKHRTQHNTSAAVTVATQLHSSALDEVQDIVAGTDSQVIQMNHTLSISNPLTE